MKKTTKKRAAKKAIAKKTVAKRVASKRTRRVVPPIISQEIDRRFDFVDSPTAEQVETCVELRAAHKQLAQLVGRATPICREQSLAITKLEEALFYAIAATVRPNKGE